MGQNLPSQPSSVPGFTQVEGNMGFTIGPNGIPIFGGIGSGQFVANPRALTPEQRAMITERLFAQPGTDFLSSAFSQLMGLSESQFGLQSQQLGISNALLNRLVGLSEASQRFGFARFNEASPIRNALIGAVQAEMGIPTSTTPPRMNKRGEIVGGRGALRRGIPFATPEARDLFRPDISPEIETAERGLSLARDEILSATPGRGGALQASLSQLPLQRTDIRTGLTAAANEIRRQRVLSLGSALGLQAPELAQQGLATGIGGLGSAAGTSAGLTGQLGQLGLGALSTLTSGALGMRGQDIGSALAFADIASRERIGAEAQAGAKKGATGSGVGAGVGGIAAAIGIAI